MIPQQPPAPRRRPVIAIAVTAAITAVLVAAAIIALAFTAGGGEDTAPAAAAAGPDPMTMRACEAAQRAMADPDDQGAPLDALAAAGQADDADLRAINREWNSGAATAIRATTGVYKVHTWCLNNGVLKP